MSDEIRCPACGSQDVECVESPHHDHRCYACGHTLLGGPFNPTVDLAELDRLMRAARKDVWSNTTTTHTRPALIAGLASQAEALRRALADAAAWVVRDVGIPVDMSTAEPPPDALRQAMYRYCFDDPDSSIHGGDLTYDELVAFVDQEARWLPVGMTGDCEDDCIEQCQGPCGVGDLGAADEAARKAKGGES